MDSSINNDLLTEIFPRLPTKSLVRFKSVSKEFRSLISEVLREGRPPETMSGFFYTFFDEDTDFGPLTYASIHDENDICVGTSNIDSSLSFLPLKTPEFALSDCCNGLVLCVDDLISPSVYYVCNPATAKWVALPNPTDRVTFFNALAFDPQVSPHYKVIRFLDYRPPYLCLAPQQPSCMRLEIFSSETGKWVESKMFQEPTNHYFHGDQARAIFLNGSLYMLGLPHHIVGFDVKEERSWLIELPENLTLGNFGCLGASGGYLHYATITMQNGIKLQICMLEDQDARKWVLKHSIDFKDLFGHYCGSQCLPLAFHPDIDAIFVAKNGKVLSYDLNSRRMEEVHSLISETTLILWFWVFPFSPCLSHSFEDTHQWQQRELTA